MTRQLYDLLATTGGDADAVTDHQLAAIGATRHELRHLANELTGLIGHLQQPIGSDEDIATFLVELDRLNMTGGGQE